MKHEREDLLMTSVSGGSAYRSRKANNRRRIPCRRQAPGQALSCGVLHSRRFQGVAFEALVIQADLCYPESQHKAVVLLKL